MIGYERFALLCFYRDPHQELQDIMLQAFERARQPGHVIFVPHRPSNDHLGRYNLPISNEEIAGDLDTCMASSRAARSIVAQPRAVDGSDAGAGADTRDTSQL